MPTSTSSEPERTVSVPWEITERCDQKLVWCPWHIVADFENSNPNASQTKYQKQRQGTSLVVSGDGRGITQ
jgi:hypothetical protein